jgi:hypothetical protein
MTFPLFTDKQVGTSLNKNVLQKDNFIDDENINFSQIIYIIFDRLKSTLHIYIYTHIKPFHFQLVQCLLLQHMLQCYRPKSDRQKTDYFCVLSTLSSLFSDILIPNSRHLLQYLLV